MDWLPGVRDSSHSVVCVWPCTVLSQNEIPDFVHFVRENLGARIKVIGNVTRKGTTNIDLMFLVHDDDIPAMAPQRFRFGMRWLEDVLGNGESYPGDFLAAYPLDL